MGASGGAVGVPAALGKRLGARLVDSLIASIPMLPFLPAYFEALATMSAESDTAPTSIDMIGDALRGLSVGSGISLVVGLVQLWLLGSKGWSLGKRLMGISLVDASTGAPLGIGRAFLRELMFGLLTGVVFLGIISIFLDSSGRRAGWHDKMVNANVVDGLPGRAPSSTRPAAARPAASAAGRAGSVPQPAPPLPGFGSASVPPAPGYPAPPVSVPAPGVGAPVPGPGGPVPSVQGYPPVPGQPLPPAPGHGYPPAPGQPLPPAPGQPLPPAPGQGLPPAPRQGFPPAPGQGLPPAPGQPLPPAPGQPLPPAPGQPLPPAPDQGFPPAPGQGLPPAPGQGLPPAPGQPLPPAPDQGFPPAPVVPGPTPPVAGPPAPVAVPAPAPAAAQPAPAGGATLITSVPGSVRADASPALATAPAVPTVSDQLPSGGLVLDEDLELTRLRPRTTEVPAVDDGAIPASALLRISDGRELTITGTVLVGRNPAAGDGEEVGELVRVSDPGRSVSKTHVMIGVDDEGVWAADRASTNGTVVTLADGQQIICAENQVVRLPEGSSVTFGDYSISFEFRGA